ncbi:MAG: DUF998 domain-containing protein [Maribacter sp.]|nr:DUF998 domain-containing protein [Maribacter sp.]
MKGALEFLVPPYLILLLVIFILPFYSVESYSILQNTSSHLGAQHSPYAWVMNTTFVLLGLGTMLSGWPYLKGFGFHKLALLIFGFSLIGAAIYQHAPIIVGVTFDAKEDRMHSIFSSLTGASFTVFAIGAVFILRHRTAKISALSVGALAILLSVLIFTVPEFKGIWQRALFIVAFGWLIVLFNGQEKGKQRPYSF